MQSALTPSADSAARDYYARENTAPGSVWAG